MRRTDREVTDPADILAILDKCEVMRIALSVDDRPYLVPVNFAYEVRDGELFVYAHSALSGRKLEMIDMNDTVCIEADCSFKIRKGERACDWGAEYESVIGEGKIAIVDDYFEKAAALDLLMKRYGFEEKPQYSPAELFAVAVLQIRVSSITGKRRT